MTTVSAVTQIEEAEQEAGEGQGDRRRGACIPGGGQGRPVRGSGLQGWLLPGQRECTCRDAQYRSEVHKGWCKHMLAVELYKESQPQEEPRQPEGTRSLEEQLTDLV